MKSTVVCRVSWLLGNQTIVLFIFPCWVHEISFAIFSLPSATLYLSFRQLWSAANIQLSSMTVRIGLLFKECLKQIMEETLELGTYDLHPVSWYYSPMTSYWVKLLWGSPARDWHPQGVRGASAFSENKQGPIEHIAFGILCHTIDLPEIR